MLFDPKRPLLGRILSPFSSLSSYLIARIWLTLILVISGTVCIVLSFTQHNPTLLILGGALWLANITMQVVLFGRRKRVLFADDLYSTFLKNSFDNLVDVHERYFRNLEHTSKKKKDDVKINEDEFNQHLWTLASDLMQIQPYLKSDNILSTNESAVFGDTINAIKGEISKLDETIKNLVSISAYESRQSIKEKYSVTTAADTLKAVSKIKLQATLQLGTGDKPIEQHDTTIAL